MAVPHPQQHDFSPLWLNFPSNTKSVESSQRAKSGFASLTPGRISETSNWRIPSPALIPKAKYKAFSQDVNGNKAGNFNGDFPSLQAELPAKPQPVDNGAWASPRNKAKQQYVTNVGSVVKPPVAKPRMSYPTTTRSVKLKLAPAVVVPECEGPPSPNNNNNKAKLVRPDTKLDFFKALRKEEGYEEEEEQHVEHDRSIDASCGEGESCAIEPLSSSVETEHRLLKEMGWCDELEPPLTEEEMGEVKREIEHAKKNKSPPTLKPFPWVTAMDLSDDNEDLSSSDDEY